ncbi:hypothetical protein C8R43DRAFT_1125093 [Mycena crocata]|nr:hypothetical protein C8R43DRAFT_1125093 [Mycena crocata]
MDPGTNCTAWAPSPTRSSILLVQATNSPLLLHIHSARPLADLIVTYDTFTPLAKQAVVLYEAPANGSYATLLSQLADMRVGAVYITDKGNTHAAFPSKWAAFVRDVANTQIPSTLSSATGASSTESTSPSTDQTVGVTGKRQSTSAPSPAWAPPASTYPSESRASLSRPAPSPPNADPPPAYSDAGV